MSRLGCELSGKVLLEMPGECLGGRSPAVPRHSYTAMGGKWYMASGGKDVEARPMGRDALAHKDAVSSAK